MESFIEALIKANEDYRAFRSSFKHARASIEAWRAFLTLKRKRSWQVGEHVASDPFDFILRVACSVGLRVIVFIICFVFMPNSPSDPEEDKTPLLLLVYLPILFPLIWLIDRKPYLGSHIRWKPCSRTVAVFLVVWFPEQRDEVYMILRTILSLSRRSLAFLFGKIGSIHSLGQTVQFSYFCSWQREPR